MNDIGSEFEAGRQAQAESTRGVRTSADTQVLPRRHAALLEARSLVAGIPDEPFTTPPAELMATILEQPARFREAVIEVLAGGPAPDGGNESGWRVAWLISIVGDWRDASAIPVLIQHLKTSHHYGWDDLIQAFTRIGAPALRPLVRAALSQSLDLTARRRALRALGSLALAARRHGNEAAWRSEAGHVLDEVIATLRLFLYRERVEAQELVQESASLLCDLRVEAAWERIESLLRSGKIPADADFTLQIARSAMNGRLSNRDLGGYHYSYMDSFRQSPDRYGTDRYGTDRSPGKPV